MTDAVAVISLVTLLAGIYLVFGLGWTAIIAGSVGLIGVTALAVGRARKSDA